MHGYKGYNLALGFLKSVHRVQSYKRFGRSNKKSTFLLTSHSTEKRERERERERERRFLSNASCPRAI